MPFGPADIPADLLHPLGFMTPPESNTVEKKTAQAGPFGPVYAVFLFVTKIFAISHEGRAPDMAASKPCPESCLNHCFEHPPRLCGGRL